MAYRAPVGTTQKQKECETAADVSSATFRAAEFFLNGLESIWQTFAGELDDHGDRCDA